MSARRKAEGELAVDVFERIFFWVLLPFALLMVLAILVLMAPEHDPLHIDRPTNITPTNVTPPTMDVRDSFSPDYGQRYFGPPVPSQWLSSTQTYPTR